MTEAYIIDAVRTPRGSGKPGKGALTHLHPQYLAATVLTALRQRNDFDTAQVDDVICRRGCRAAIWAAWRLSTPVMTYGQAA